jgi:Protein of unknown function (DUF2889)
VTDQPIHRRSIVVESFHHDETFGVVGTLRDERPWRNQQPVLHDMELQLTVMVDGLVITSAEAFMHSFPHEECPFIAPKFAELVGLSISRGFTRALRERFAGVSSCQHLHELARVTGPAVFQARAALRGQARANGAGPDGAAADDADVMRRSLVGTCHIWSEDGPGVQKLDLGWRPGNSGYPAPSVKRLQS